MHDINGKTLHIGNEVYSPAYGLLTIKAILDEHNQDKGGSLVEVFAPARGAAIVLRTHEDRLTKVPTWKELASEALAVQDACNLSGVIHAFSSAIASVRSRLEVEGKGGTDNVNRHPVCQLYADKVASLTGTQTMGNDEVMTAYKWAYEKVQK